MREKPSGEKQLEEALTLVRTLDRAALEVTARYALSLYVGNPRLRDDMAEYAARPANLLAAKVKA